MKKTILAIALSLLATGPSTARADHPNWDFDIGVRWFKLSSEGGPNELGFNPVFDRWERIQQDSPAYDVSEYTPLEPLYFNMDFGVDLLVRYRTYFFFRLGYDYTNPFGIGGTGSISYTDLSSAVAVAETKTFSYVSHQINTFFGPFVPVGERAEVYLGISPMAPTWVRYEERYSRTDGGTVVESYDRTFRGFFGSCRVLVGAQARVTDHWKLGAEVVFAFLNYMPLESGEIQDYSFRFPSMMWNFVVRYELP